MNDDEWEMRLEHGGPHGAPCVLISEDRYKHLLRIAGQAKKRAVEYKIEDYVRQNVETTEEGNLHTVVLRFDPIRIVGTQMYSREMVNCIQIPDLEGTIARDVRRRVKQLLYDMVMQDVAEHPDDYRGV